MKKGLAIFFTIALFGCSKDENLSIANQIFEKVDFTIDGVDRSFQNEQTWEGLSFFTRSAFTSIVDDLSSDAIWFGIHLNYDFNQELINLSSSEEKLNFVETSLTALDNSLVSINSVLSDEYECCFVCYGEFESIGYSVQLFENDSSCENKEIWSSSYGLQTNSQIKVKKIENLSNPDRSNQRIATDMIMATFEFYSILYNNKGQQREITGEITVPIHSYKNILP